MSGREEVTDARDAILAAVRAALADGAGVQPGAGSASEPAAAAAARRDDRPAEDRLTDLDLLEDRLRDYRAEVHRVAGSGIRATLRRICTEHGCARVGVAPGLPASWRPADVAVVEDAALTATELDRLDGVITGATVAIAETGTLVLAGQADEGRRALTLVPDLHICIVRAAQVVRDVADAFAVLEPLAVDEQRPLTFISGPSATSDIELSRVEGVHGPRTLIVLIEEAP